jgi:predicted nucleic acid-binding protein
MNPKNVLFDTNILIELVRATDRLDALKNRINPHNLKVAISIVSVAEVRTFAINSGWGRKRLDALEELLDTCTIIDIGNAITEKYVEIDTYNARKNPNYPIMQGNTVNMGKNDIWIAATALLLDFTLVTTDKDFDHLNSVVIEVDYVGRDAEGKIVVPA